MARKGNLDRLLGIRLTTSQPAQPSRPTYQPSPRPQQPSPIGSTPRGPQRYPERRGQLQELLPGVDVRRVSLEELAKLLNQKLKEETLQGTYEFRADGRKEILLFPNKDRGIENRESPIAYINVTREHFVQIKSSSRDTSRNDRRTETSIPTELETFVKRLRMSLNRAAEQQ